MEIVHAQEPFPTTVKKSIFLAGPTPRSVEVAGWRDQALEELKSQGYDGTVYVPEPRGGVWKDAYNDQVEWEEAALFRADCILFWVPRDMKTMPALTTNVEWGVWADSGKAVLGTPPEATSVRYLRHYAEKYGVPVSDSLAETVRSAIRKVGEGALRSGGECEVPVHVWRHPTFQGWYKAQVRAGNRLDGFRVLSSFFVGPSKNFLFSWKAHVNVYIDSENRNKTNEYVFGRTDISSVLLYKPNPSILDTEVVLVREFRSPARTSDGMIHELPRGSSKDTKEKTLSVAVHETEEETGYTPTSLTEIGSRQVAGTLSAHMATLFSSELSEGALEFINKGVDQPRGVVEDTKRTYSEIWTVRDLLAQPGLVDWATLGMIFTALHLDHVRRYHS